MKEYINPDISTGTMDEGSSKGTREQYMDWVRNIWYPNMKDFVERRKVDGVIQKVGGSSDCLTADQFDAYVVNKYRLARRSRETFERHYEECNTCAEVVEALFEELRQGQSQHPVAVLYRKGEELYYKLKEYWIARVEAIRQRDTSLNNR